MSQPVIGIVGNLLIEQGGFSPGMERSYVNNDYVSAVESAGGLPVILPPVRGQDVAEKLADHADALLISGGYDIDPLLYRKSLMKHLDSSTAILTSSSSGRSGRRWQKESPFSVSARASSS